MTDIMRKKWRVGFPDGSGIEPSRKNHAVSITAYDDDWDVSVNIAEIPFRTSQNSVDIAEHIVRLHNESFDAENSLKPELPWAEIEAAAIGRAIDHAKDCINPGSTDWHKGHESAVRQMELFASSVKDTGGRAQKLMDYHKPLLDEWMNASAAQVLKIAPMNGNFSEAEIDGFVGGFKRCARELLIVAGNMNRNHGS